MKKIVIVDGYRGAFSNFRAQLIDDMVAKGHHVIAMAPDLDEAHVEALAARGVDGYSIPLDRTGTSISKDLRTFLCLSRALRRVRPDVLLLYSSKPVIYGAIAGRWAGVGTIAGFITGLGYAFGPRTGLGRILAATQKLLYALSLRFCDLVFFQNPDDLEVFRQGGLLSEQARTELIAGSGVDIEHFAPAPCPEVCTFLMVGRLLRAKGLEEYCLAAGHLRAKYPGVTFRVVGWLDQENPDSFGSEELHALFRDNGVEFLGRLEDVRPALADCTVYVLPSYREGTPRSTLEALATGRAIVTTDAPGCRETVVHDKNGFLVPVRDYRALAIAMERFILNPALAEAMGEESRRLCESKFDVRKVNDKILAETGLSTGGR